MYMGTTETLAVCCYTNPLRREKNSSVARTSFWGVDRAFETFALAPHSFETSFENYFWSITFTMGLASAGASLLLLEEAWRTKESIESKSLNLTPGLSSSHHLNIFTTLKKVPLKGFAVLDTLHNLYQRDLKKKHIDWKSFPNASKYVIRIYKFCNTARLLRVNGLDMLICVSSAAWLVCLSSLSCPLYQHQVWCPRSALPENSKHSQNQLYSSL